MAKDLEKQRRDLEDKLRKIAAEEREAAYANRTCRVCGEKEEGYGGSKGYLTPFEIRVNPGEEGHSEINSYLCEEDLTMFADMLAECGLTIHAHGGICFLEDRLCPGHETYGACPTPEDQYPE